MVVVTDKGDSDKVKMKGKYNKKEIKEINVAYSKLKAVEPEVIASA